jgi:hypothetical protein
VKLIKIFCISLIIITVTYCCRDEVCTQTFNSDVSIGLYENKLNANPFYAFSAFGIGRSDSILYDSTSKISPIKLPLDQNNDESKFVMDFTLLTDTLYIPDSTFLKDSIIAPNSDTLHIYKHSFKIKFKTETFSDTLTIQYSRKIELFSPECGFITNFELNEIHFSHNAIDSGLINEPIINNTNDINNNSNAENIKIFI